MNSQLSCMQFDPFHKSQNASLWHRNDLFISVPSGALWDMELMYCEICDMAHHPQSNLDQVMAYFPMATSYPLIPCWFTVYKIFGSTSSGISSGVVLAVFRSWEFAVTPSKLSRVDIAKHILRFQYWKGNYKKIISCWYCKIYLKFPILER